MTAGQKRYATSLLRWRAAEGDFAPWTRTGTIITGDGELRLDPPTATAGTDPFGPGGYRGGTFYNGGSFLVGEATSPVIATPEPVPGGDRLVERRRRRRGRGSRP